MRGFISAQEAREKSISNRLENKALAMVRDAINNGISKGLFSTTVTIGTEDIGQSPEKLRDWIPSILEPLGYKVDIDAYMVYEITYRISWEGYPHEKM